MFISKDISEEYRTFGHMRKTGSIIFDNGLLLSLFFFLLLVGLPRAHDSSSWQSQVFKKSTQVQWLENAVDPQRDSLPLEPRDKPLNLGEQPDDDDGNHSYPELLEGLCSWRLSLFSFAADTYPAVNQDIPLPPPKA